MKAGIIACALGRHSIARDSVMRAHGRSVGKCRRCATALEERYPDDWVKIAVRDAGLGLRSLR